MIIVDSAGVDSILTKGLNVHAGEIYDEVVAHAHGYEHFKI